MSKERSTTLYPHPFSKAYWHDAASEMNSTKMLVITALMTALRIALKPLAIPLGPQLSIQTAMLATALGAMIFGPVVAIPAAIVSDTIGFMIYPTGDYFLPFVLTEIASTVIYALCLYRSKVTPTRVILSRFLICLFVNVILQQFIYGWYYVYIGNPDKAKEQILGILTVSRIFKNLAFFPLESVVLTLFLRFLLPVTKRAGLTFCSNEEMKFGKKQILTLIALTLAGCLLATGYFTYRYDTTSRSSDYSTEERPEFNRKMTQVVLDNTDSLDSEATYVGIIDSAYRPIFGTETDYTVSLYRLDEEAFAAGQVDNDKYTMDTLWAYSKSGPKKDAYGSLIAVGTATFTYNEESESVSDFSWVQIITAE